MTITNMIEAFDAIARIRFILDEMSRGPGWGKRLRKRYIAAGSPYGTTDEGALRWLSEQRSTEMNAL